MENLVELGVFVIIFLQFCITIFSIASDPVIENKGIKKITPTGKITIGVALAITIIAFGMQYHQIKGQHQRTADSQGALIYAAHLLMLETAGVVVQPDILKKLGRRGLDERREMLILTLLTSQSSLDPDVIRLTRSMDEKIRRWLRVIDIDEELVDPLLPIKMYKSSRNFKHKLCNTFFWSDRSQIHILDAKYKNNSLHNLCAYDEGPMRENFEKQCAKIKPVPTLCNALLIIDMANSKLAQQNKNKKQ